MSNEHAPPKVSVRRKPGGPRYFVTTCWQTLRERKPDVVDYLSRYKVVAPPKSWPDDYRVVDLR